MIYNAKLIVGSTLAACLMSITGLAAVPTTQADPSLESQKQLQDEVHELRSELDAVKQQQATAQQPASTAPSNTTGLQLAPGPMVAPQTGFTAGYKQDRFTIQSDDGAFVFRPWLHLQLRDVTSIRQDFKVGGENEVDNGFELRRLRYGFDGNLFGPNLTYFFNWATVRASGTATVTNGGRTVGSVSNNLGGTPLLEEAWVKYAIPSTPFFLHAGQIKDPVYHESIASSRYQLASERSLISDIFFNGDTFAEGATVGYDPNDCFRAETGIDHGLRSANTNFLDYPNSNAFNYGGVARAEFKLMGRWQDYQMGGWGVKEPLLVIGAGGEYSERGHSGQTVADVDLMYADPSGWSTYCGFTDRYTNHNFGIALQSPTGANIAAPPATVLDTATNEYGLEANLAYLIGGQLEPFGRFEYIHLQGTPVGAHNYIPSITGGANYYFYGHRCKLTVQGSYLPNGIPIDDTPNDVLASPAKRGEFVGIAQLQLLI